MAWRGEGAPARGGESKGLKTRVAVGLQGKERRMSKEKRGKRIVLSSLCIAAVLALTVVGLASCGSGTGKSSGTSTTKLPPGAEETSAAENTASTAPSTTASSTEASTTPSSSSTSSSDSKSTTSTETTATTPNAFAVLGGGKFTMVGATRPDTNSSVISSSGREVKGDYLEVAFTIENTATDYMVDLSEYSFRLESPGIAASSYSNYYGNTGTYGAYVDDNEISATLLDYATLNPVAYLLKVGESVDKVFVFFDLNPENVGKNPNVTKDNSTLVIRKVSGDEYGTEVTIPLAGYPD